MPRRLTLKKAQTRGRRSVPVASVPVGPLTEEDLIERALHGSAGISTEVKVHDLRDSHHMVAKMLALGFRPMEVSEVTGYRPAWISTLQNDQAMQSLIAHYRQEGQSSFNVLLERIRLLSKEAVSELLQRFIDEPDKFSNKDLLTIANSALDRCGFSPVQRSEETKLTLTGEDLAGLKAAAAEAEAGNIIDLREVREEAQGE